MRRKTPRTNNPYREVYKQYAETQLTLEEILDKFNDYTIYGTLDNTEIHIVDTKLCKEYLFFESIGYDDDDCTPTLYQASPYLGFGTDFDDIINCYLDDHEKITKLN